jgi:hypothetical protein
LTPVGTETAGLTFTEADDRARRPQPLAAPERASATYGLAETVLDHKPNSVPASKPRIG